MSRPMRIDSITVGERFRTDLGDLGELKNSIATVGLLHPVVVTAEGRLVAGQRRLEAVRSLGWRSVPVTVVSSLDGLLRAAEREENVCRKDLSPSEAVAMGALVEALERPRAAARKAQAAGKRQGAKQVSSVKLTEEFDPTCQWHGIDRFYVEQLYPSRREGSGDYLGAMSPADVVDMIARTRAGHVATCPLARVRRRRSPVEPERRLHETILEHGPYGCSEEPF